MADQKSWDLDFSTEQVVLFDLYYSQPKRCSNKTAFGDNCGHIECAYCHGKKYAPTEVDLEKNYHNQHARPLSWLVKGLLNTATIQRPRPMTAAEFDEIEQLDQEIEAKMKQRNWELLDFAIIDSGHISLPSDRFFGYTEIPHVGRWRSVDMELRQVEAWVSTLENLAICAELSEIRNRYFQFLADLPDRFRTQGPTKIQG